MMPDIRYLRFEITFVSEVQHISRVYFAGEALTYVRCPADCYFLSAAAAPLVPGWRPLIIQLSNFTVTFKKL